MKRIILVILILSAISCSKNDKATLPPESKIVKKSGPVLKEAEPLATEKVRLVGQVSSMNRAVLMFQTQGIIEKIHGRTGMLMKKGSVIAELDSKNHQFQLEMAKSQYQQALNQKAIAERNFNIDKQLHDKQLTSDLAFEQSKTQFENASLAADTAHTQYKIAQKAFDDTKLRAPYDCYITKQMKYVGESTAGVGPPDGPSAFEIYDAQPPELIFNAPESLLGKIKNGAEMTVWIPALKENFAAKVVRYVPVIADATRTFVVVAHLLKPDPRVVQGYFIEGTL